MGDKLGRSILIGLIIPALIGCVGEEKIRRVKSTPIQQDGTLVSTSLSVSAMTVTAVEDEAAAFDLSGKGTSTSYYEIIELPTKGKLNLLNKLKGSVSYLPITDATGSDSFTYRLVDGVKYSEPAKVEINITPVNDLPVASNLDLVTDEDATVSGKFSAVDPENGLLEFKILDLPKKGMVTITDSKLGTFTYVPNLNANGTDTFTFVSNDGTADSAPAQVSVIINPVNDKPVALTQNVRGELFIPFNLTLQGTDVEGSELEYTITSFYGGTYTGTAPNIVFTPIYTGRWTLSFYVTEKLTGLRSESATIIMDFTNPAPGKLDNSFDGDGKMLFSYDGGELDVPVQLELDPGTNKFLVLGQGGQNYSMSFRFNVNGDVDSTFGFAGIGNYMGLKSPKKMKVLSNGYHISIGSQSSTSIACNPNYPSMLCASATYVSKAGNFVSTWGTNGTQSNLSLATPAGIHSGTGLNASVLPDDIDTLSDGTAFVGLTEMDWITNKGRYGLIKLTPAGQIDTTFGTNGRVIFSQQVQKVLVGSDQSIYVSLIGDGINLPKIIKLNPSTGVQDTTFGASGSLNLSAAGKGYMIKQLRDNRIFACPLLTDRAYMMSATGIVDNTFATTALNNGCYDMDFKYNGSNQLVSIVGLSNTNGSTTKIFKLTPLGILDSAYATGGINDISLNANFQFIQNIPASIRYTTDGKILVLVKTFYQEATGSYRRSHGIFRIWD